MPFTSTNPDNQHVPNAQPSEMVTVTCGDRWQVYHRLQELEIPCQCSGFEPLQVQVRSPADTVQLWSIVRRVSEPRLKLAAGLRQCWKISR